ncbi:hypothetical protein ACI75Y_07170 [Capnocytophaga stomatis]|uniref:hypothetical protein n=1 Tax=Capnocytophaga TaxID=1016 RepID=UPI0028E656CF|nr:hypothetical protein [Capnocytophaga canimorsus]MDT9499143.1 hypothetical protein [Capnocytophaga canimorsus]
MFNPQEKTTENHGMQLFAYLESLQPKWTQLSYARGSFYIRLNLRKHRYHYAEGKTLEELLVNLRLRIESFQQAS